MSLVEDAIRINNERCAEDCHNATIEHMKELDRQRKLSEETQKNSVKGAWEKLHAKRQPKVLGGLLPIQLQHN